MTAVRVLMFGINYEPELAGIAPYTTGLAKHFASEGHAVTVITGVPHYPQWKRLPYKKGSREDNPRVRRYQHFIPKRPRAFGRSLYEVTWLMSASRALPRAKSDVVVAVVPSLSGAVLGWLAARSQRIPFGIIFQDLMGSAALQSGYTGARRLSWLASRIELSLARQAAGVAVVASGFRPYLEAGGVRAGRISRVHNWAGSSTPTVPADEMRRRNGWRPDEFICLHAGNMGRKQGLDNLLTGAQLLVGTDVRLVFAGDGNDRSRIVAKAKSLDLPNVQFLGVQPSGVYESILRAADVLVLNQRPSVSDMALPSKLSSYFAAGRPVVAAAAQNSGASEEVELAGGIVVAPDDPAGLAAAILALREDPAARARTSEAARRHFKGHLDRPVVLAEFDSYLQALIGRDVSPLPWTGGTLSSAMPTGITTAPSDRAEA